MSNKIRETFQKIRDEFPCLQCNGRGMLGIDEKGNPLINESPGYCSECNGTGINKEKRYLYVKE